MADSSKQSPKQTPVATKSIPLVQTKAEYLEQEQKRDPRAMTFELLFAMAGASGIYSRKPTYNDQNEVASRAHKDINNMDFSEMWDYIDSLTQIADQWQEYAEHYFSELKALGAVFDDYGYVDYIDDQGNDLAVSDLTGYVDANNPQ